MGPGKIADRRTGCRTILASRGIYHHLDDWGPAGGAMLYWKHQMWEYVSQLFSGCGAEEEERLPAGCRRYEKVMWRFRPGRSVLVGSGLLLLPVRRRSRHRSVAPARLRVWWKSRRRVFGCRMGRRSEMHAWELLVRSITPSYPEAEDLCRRPARRLDRYSRRCGSIPEFGFQIFAGTRCLHETAPSNVENQRSLLQVAVLAAEVIASRAVANKRAVYLRWCGENFTGWKIRPVATADQTAGFHPVESCVKSGD